MPITRDLVLAVEAEAYPLAIRASELQTVDRQAHLAVGMVAPFHPFDFCETLDTVQQCDRALGQGLAARVNARLEIGVVPRIDGFFRTVGEVRENRADRGAGIQVPHAMAGHRFLSCRDEDGQTLQAHIRVTTPEVIEPDEAEGQSAVGIQRIFGRANRGQSRAALAQQSPGIAGGQAVVQVGSGAQLRDAPAGKLAQQRAAKALPILEPGAAARHVAAGWMRQIHQFQASRAPAEAFHFQLQPGPMFGMHRHDAPHQVRGFAPNLQGDPIAAPFQPEIVRADGDGVVARVEHRGAPARFEEPLYRQTSFARSAGLAFGVWFFGGSRAHT